jgi:hypothetical protein
MLVVHRREGRWEDRESRSSAIFEARRLAGVERFQSFSGCLGSRKDQRAWPRFFCCGRFPPTPGSGKPCASGCKMCVKSHACEAVCRDSLPRRIGERTLRFADGPDVYEQLISMATYRCCPISSA